MFIDKNGLTMDGINMGKYLKQVKFGYHKFWGSDSGRNLAMEVTGSFKRFPKLTLTFRKLTKQDIDIIAPILEKAVQSVRFYYPPKKTYITIQTYTSDWEVVSKDMYKLEPFDCSVISRKAVQ